MNKITSDYLRAVRSQLKHLPIRERDAVLGEIEDHIETETKRLRQEDKTLSADEAALKATNAFGAPDEIGVAYGAHGGVINRSTGERLLDVAVLTGRAAGRGIKGVLKWTGISVLIVIGIALVVLVAGLVFADNIIDTFQDDIRSNVPHPLYSNSGSWPQTDPHTESTMDTFELREGVKEFIIDINISPTPNTGGCLRITLTNPTGGIAYDSGTDCGAESRTLTLSQKGTWQVQYAFVAFSGSMDVQAYYFEDASSQS